jgi:Ca-activated chloride channel family protein
MLAMILATVAAAAASAPPLALRVDVQPLGKGPQGTVVGVALQVAPEDLSRAGERLRVGLTLVRGDKVLDTTDAVVTLEQDGSALLYRDWPPGEAEVRMEVSSLDGNARGGWVGKVVVPVESKPFEAGPDSPPDALVLAPLPPATGVVHFRPPARSGGIEALELHVDVPEGTAKVEFYKDGQLLFQRQRQPWTVAVPLAEVAKRTVVKAVAYDNAGNFLGEDSVVLNAPANQLPVDILLGPEPPAGQGRLITVSVGGSRGLSEVVLHVDDKPVVRWTACPCVVRLAPHALEGAKVLSADATNLDGVRGEAVRVLGTTSGYTASVVVDVVELPVTVFDGDGKLVTGLPRDAFHVFEDDKEVPLESFGTSAELPLALGILVDTSGSMLQEFPEVRTAVAGFASHLLRAGDSYFLMTFSFEPHMVVEWATDPQGLVGALERVTPVGGTSLFDAIVRSLEQFRGRRGRSALVLLSDGDDNTSRVSWAVALRYVHTVRVPIFTIGYGIGRFDFLIRSRLKELATATGAEVFYAAKKKGNLADVYRRIDEQLRAQYLLTYRAPSGKPADQFRTVRVEVKGDGLTARTIAGYFPAQ